MNMTCIVDIDIVEFGKKKMSSLINGLIEQ